MQFFTKLKNIFKRAEPTEPKESYNPRLGATSMIETLTGDTALSVSTVFCCVKLLSESVASLPLQYFIKKGEIYKDSGESRIASLLSVEPNPNTSAFDFWRQVVQELLLEGNAYIVPEYNPTTLELDRLTLCTRGTVAHDIIANQYTVLDTINGIKGTFNEGDILHIKNISLDGKNGLSTLAYARLTTSIAATGDRETLNRFANGGNVRGLVTNDDSVRGFGEYQDEELKNAAISIDDQFSSGQKIVSVPGQADFKQISLSSTDMQFLESRKFTVREICRFFQVHPSFVFDDTSNNYKSAEMAMASFLSTTLNPILRKIENELLRKLVDYPLRRKRKFEFDRSEIYATDLAGRINYQTKTIEAGIYTVNFWRKKENQEPVEGGDTIFISTNLRDIKAPINNQQFQNDDKKQ